MNNPLQTFLQPMAGLQMALVCAFFWTAQPSSAQDNFILPPDANVYVVTQAPFNADNTGATDATAAIQAALDSAGTISNSDRFNLIYFPNGTYLVSNELQWRGARTRDVFQGESRDGVILKLTNNHPGFQDKSQSKGMIFTGDFGPPNPGANRFRNSIYNMTLNTGIGNPGATGARFYANNQGGMFNVLIKSEDGEGNIGLDMGFDQDNGPLLIEDVTVEGFDTGIRTAGVVNSITLRDVTLQDQKVQGFLNENQVVSVENLLVTGQVPGVVTQGIAMFTIINSTFTGSGAAATVPAITNSNGLFARNITTTGYLQAIDNSGAGTGILTTANDIVEFSSHEVQGLFSSPKQSLNLPIKVAPVIPLADTSDWVNVTDFMPVDTLIGSNTIQNWVPALQQAIDAGKSTVYFPGGARYKLVGEVIVRGNVERIIGLESKVEREGSASPTFIVESGTAPAVVIERFTAIGTRIKVVHRANRTLILRNMEANLVEVETGAGDVFLEDMVFGSLRVDPGNHVWARQLDLESSTAPKIENRGADVWVLGIKTEQDADICITTQNGRTEVLGGLIFANAANNPDKIMFDIEEGSSVSFSIGEFVLRRQPFNTVRETRDGFTRVLKATDTPGRGGGALVPLYTGYRPSATTLPVAPSNLAGQVLRYNQIVLDWQDNSDNEDGFVLQRKEGTGDFINLDIAFAGDTLYNDSTLNPSTQYTYRIAATNVVGQSAFSNEFTATTLQAPPPPAAPTGFSAQLVNGIYQFTWNDNATTETGYRVERKALQDDSVFQARAVLPANATSFSDSLYLGSTDYEYRVIAFLEISDSPPSNIASFTTGQAVDATIRWSYEETAGTIAQDGGFLDRDGTLLNGLTFENASVNGVFGKGIVLDGDEHLVRYNLGNIIDDIEDYPFTLSTWVKTNSNRNQTATYFGGSTLFDLYYTIGTNGGRSRLVVRRIGNATDIVQGPEVADGKWHQLVAVFKAANRFELYQDGQFIGASDSTRVRTFVTQGYNFSAGALDRFRGSNNDPDANPTDPFDGALDETQLYYRVLKPREILAEYQRALNQPAPSAPTGLVLSNAAPSEIFIQWTDNSNGEADFILQRKRSTDSVFINIADLQAGTTQFTDTGLNGFTTYDYQVQAVRGLQESAFTPVATLTTGEGTPPIVKWAFESLNGQVAIDSSGAGNNGTLINDFTFEGGAGGGVFGNGLSFDGVNDAVRLNNPGISGFPFSMSVWVNTTASGKRNVLYLGDKDNNNRYFTIFLDNGRPTLEVRNDGSPQNARISTTINDGQWHLVTGVFSGVGKYDLYVDGELLLTNTANVSFNSGIDRFSVGALDRPSITQFYLGALDEPVLYDRELGGQEVLGLYLQAITGPPNTPSGLELGLGDPNEVLLQWNDNATDESGFVVQRKEEGDTLFTDVAQLPKNTTSYADANLKGFTRYFYRITATRGLQASAPSNEATIVTGENTGGLLVRWDFNDSSGTVASDLSGNNLAGTLNDMDFITNGVPGILGGALDFQGGEDRVFVQDESVFGPAGYPFTLSAWVNTTNSGVVLFLGDKSDSDTYFNLRVSGPGQARLEARRNSGTVTRVTGGTVGDGQWHLVTAVFENDEYTLYVDGTLIGSTPASVSYASSIDRFSAGALDRSSIADRYTGKIDDARLYARALGATEIANLFNRPFVPLAPSSLQATAPMDSTIQLNWTDNATDELGFIIERREIGGFFAVIDTLATDSTLYTDPGLKPSRQYYYRVAAYNAFGNSDYSNIDSARTPDTVIPPAITAKYRFGVDSLSSSDGDVNSAASNFGDGPGLQGGTFYLLGLRGVNQQVLTKELQDAITGEDYFEFTLTPGQGLKTNLSQLNFFAKRTFGGPKKVAILTSVDSFTNTHIEKLRYWWRYVQVDFSDSLYQAVEGPVTFRLYPYGKKTVNNKWLVLKNVLVDNVTLEAGFTTGPGGQGAGGAGQRVAAVQVEADDDESPTTYFMRAYPNPAQDVLHLQFGKSLPHEMRVMVFNLHGRLIMEHTIPGESQDYTLPFHGMDQGLYVIKLRGVDQTREFRIIKQ